MGNGQEHLSCKNFYVPILRLNHFYETVFEACGRIFLRNSSLSRPIQQTITKVNLGSEKFFFRGQFYTKFWNLFIRLHATTKA